MKSKVTHEETVILAQPLPETPKISYSLTAFKKKAEEILARMSASNESLCLTKNGAILAVVRDWREDQKIARQRRALLAVVGSFDGKPNVGKLEKLKGLVAKEHFRKLRRAYERIESLGTNVTFAKAALYDREKELEIAKQEAEGLLEEWGKTEPKG